jgi:type I restriction enzyme S subunit
LRFLSRNFGRAYAFLTLLVRRNDLVGLRLGAAQQNISQLLIKNFPVLKPNDGLMLAFNTNVDPIFDLIEALQLRNHLLRETRDLLLPKLLSGEIEAVM